MKHEMSGQGEGDRRTEDGRVDLLELGQRVVEGEDLRGAHEGEVTAARGAQMIRSVSPGGIVLRIVWREKLTAGRRRGRPFHIKAKHCMSHWHIVVR